MSPVYPFPIFKLYILIFVHFFTLHNFHGQSIAKEFLKQKQNHIVSGHINMPCSYRCSNNMDNISLNYMKEGNKNVFANSIQSAISSFSAAEKISVGNVDILENIGECYTKQVYHYRALDTANYILELLPSNCFQGVFLKAKALQGLQRFKEAIQFVTSHIMSINEELKKSRDFVNLLKKLHRLEYQQRTGIYDMVKLYLNDEHKEDFADYIGPVKIEEIAGKGRGLVATADITPGQLLIAEKPFSIVNKENSGEWSESELEDAVAEKLRMEPEHAHRFYNLYAGPDLPFFNPDQLNGSVDYERIHGIVLHNRFESFINSKKETSSRISGLWILPAYSNHNGFDSNSFVHVFGDIMLLRAANNISKGEEITHSYIDLSFTLKKRQDKFRQHRFQCSCSLCQVDRNDSIKTRSEREKILKQIEVSFDNSKKLKTFVKQLQNLRPDKPQLNTYIIQPLLRVANEYELKGQYNEATKLLTKAHGIVKNIAFYAVESSKCSMAILGCYLAMGGQSEILKWVNIVKQDLLRAYGSIEIFKVLDPNAHKELKRRGIVL